MFVKSPKGLIIKVEKFPVVSDFPKCFLMVCEPRLCDGVRVLSIPLNTIPPHNQVRHCFNIKAQCGPSKGTLYAGSPRGNSYGGSQ